MDTGVSPILAQTFTDSFTVFSAKRFPGVPGISQSFVMSSLQTLIPSSQIRPRCP